MHFAGRLGPVSMTRRLALLLALGATAAAADEPTLTYEQFQKNAVCGGSKPEGDTTCFVLEIEEDAEAGKGGSGSGWVADRGLG